MILQTITLLLVALQASGLPTSQALSLPTESHGLLQKREPATIFSDAWSGLMINSPSNNSFFLVESQFVVPNVSLQTSNGTHSVSIWTSIGMDEYLDFSGVNGSTIRAGVKTSAIQSANGSLSISYQAFYRWLPDFSVDIPLSDLEINAGDLIDTTIATHIFDNGTTEANISLWNLNSKAGKGGQPQRKDVVLQSNKSIPGLLGSCVNIMVSVNDKIMHDERNPTIPDKLADFGTVKFDFSQIGAREQLQDGFLQNSENFTIVVPDGGKGRPLTKTTVVNDTVSSASFQIQYIGESTD